MTPSYPCSTFPIGRLPHFSVSQRVVWRDHVAQGALEESVCNSHRNPMPETTPRPESNSLGVFYPSLDVSLCRPSLTHTKVCDRVDLCRRSRSWHGALRKGVGGSPRLPSENLVQRAMGGARWLSHERRGVRLAWRRRVYRSRCSFRTAYGLGDS